MSPTTSHSFAPSLALSFALTAVSTGVWAQSAAPAAAGASATASAAPSATAPPAPSPNWGAGLLLSAETQPYKGMDNTLKVLPALQFENRWVRLFGPVLDVKLHEAADSQLALRLRYSDTGYKASDSAFLAGMAERKSGLWLGAKGEWRNGLGQLTGEWMADASNHSKGQQLKLVLETMQHLGPVALVPRLGLVWQDKKHVDYHFGVSEAEARSGRPAYAGAATLNTELGVRLLARLAPQQSVFLDLSATALGSGITDSPLVGRNTVSALRLGYLYRF